MAQITAALVKDLRDRTGAGMMDAKKALVENDGDMEAAVDWLRAKGLSKAAKKSGRAAADGLVAAVVSDDGKSGVLVELNAETDFVARNEKFQTALKQIAGVAMSTDGSVEAVANAPSPAGDGTVGDMITALVATIGENMTLRRTAKIDAPNGQVAAYVHSAEAENMGKIGVLVALEGADAAKTAEAGRKVAMHVAATSPASATVADLDPELVERERQVLTDQARESGKPDNVIEKMIEGRLQKFYKEVVLVEQPFVMNPDQTVGKYIEEQGSKLIGFVIFKLGEGVEKAEDNFAAEVASMTSGS
ncbi:MULTISPECIES: translation elongation factor Ts [Henriciella]|jgi:elongation factor Ts|uniref:Elongation factor Ts n=1 Tax=Henriciella pelagia TaxID=1977912 RepID=A0ABQ1J4F5_9PROT|nr:translation elongation factor Ts [Henriciella pelagia]GGB59807.1 elongation factor Ts [Henriciella pelagia]